MSAWIAQDKQPKRVDERFENLPPLETIHPDELKNYTRQQLSWYLEQRGIEPEETKPKMKAQLREVLKEIRVVPPGEDKYRARVNTSSTLAKIVTINPNRLSAKGAGPAQINVSINTNLLQQRATSNVIPCKVPITKASQKKARPFLNLQVRSSPMHSIPKKYAFNLQQLESLFGDIDPSELLYSAPLSKEYGCTSFEKRMQFLDSLKLNTETATKQEETRKYFKQL